MTAVTEPFVGNAYRPLAELSAARIGPDEPVITIVIPVFNKWTVTRRCLRSVFVCDPDVPISVVVVDDGSSDETGAHVARLPGVEVLRNGDNRGFVESCNRGAALARGPYILFLNNDTELRYGALRALVRRMRRDPNIGIVGSKLVYPDGRLQEAGSIIWSDATGWNYGRDDAPDRFEYNFARDADYVSGAALLVRSELFREIGGFDTRFSPGYYEDADLCFAVRARGSRVVYEPTSVVVHYEGVTSGTDLSAGMKRFQGINRVAFAAKWADVLARDHLAPKPQNVYRAARMRHSGTSSSLLVIDSYVPLYDKEAGSNRLKRLVNGFCGAGLRIVFLPDNLTLMAPYTQQLQADGVEVMYHDAERRRSWRELLAQALSAVDAVWVCRPDLFSKYVPVVREKARVPVFYDTIDLHHLRLRRQAETDSTVLESMWRKTERLELACANVADRTIVVSDYEAKLLTQAGIPDVAIVPTVHDVEMSRTLGFDCTRDLLFIGGYNHTPNVDAALWLVREIMPLVWVALPDVRVTLLGSNPPQPVRDLASDQVTVPGFVSDHDVAVSFRSARIFVAPLRFGAGLKGKIGQALGFGTPIVSTPVGVEGFNLQHESNVLIADSARLFADAIVRLYADADLWSKLSGASAAVLAPFGATRVVADALATVRGTIEASRNGASRNGRSAGLVNGVSFDGEGAALRKELRRVLRREAESYLQLESTASEIHQLARRIDDLETECAQRQVRVECLTGEIKRRDAAYATLLTIVSTLRRALQESVERDAHEAQTSPRTGRAEASYDRTRKRPSARGAAATVVHIASVLLRRLRT